MIPILFDSGEKEFKTRGLGALSDAVSCKVVEERNGSYELTLQYPKNGIHFDDIALNRIILAIPSPYREPEPFRIYKISTPMRGVITVYAQHISYDLSAVVVKPFTASSLMDTFTAIVDNSVNENNFSFICPSGHVRECSFTAPNTARQILGGISGSVLDTYGGEYEFNRFKVIWSNNRGTDNGVTIRYGKNLLSVSQNSDFSKVVDGVVPYWTNIETQETIYGGLVTRDNGSIYNRVVPLDLSQYFEAQPTIEQLESRAKTYLNANYASEANIDCTVSFALIEQSEEYKNFKLLEKCDLCDKITVLYPDLKINSSAKIVKIDTDVLRNKYNSVTIGSVRANIAQTIVEQQNAVKDIPTKKDINDEIKNSLSGILGANGGAVRQLDTNGDGYPDTLYIADDPDPNNAKNVWRFNYLGWAASNNGYNGPFAMGATLADGFLADFIKAANLVSGTIQSADGGETFYLNLDEGILRMNATSFEINSQSINYFIDDSVNRVKEEIGGRNLYPDSKKEVDFYQALVIDVYDILKNYVGKDLCVSFDFKVADDGTGYSREILVYGYQQNGISISDEYTFTPTEEWQRYSFKTIVKDWGDNNPEWTKGSIIFYDSAGENHLYIRKIKIELGTQATDWTPAPEDPASEVNAGGVVIVNSDGVYISGGEIDLRTSSGNQFVHITDESITASSIYAPNVFGKYQGPEKINVKEDASNEEIESGIYVRSLADAFSLLSDVYLEYDVTINVISDCIGDATLKGTCGGGQIIVGGEFTQNGNMSFLNVNAPVSISDLTIICSAGVGNSGITIRHSQVHMQRCNINANRLFWGIYAEYGSTIICEDSEINNSQALFGIYHGSTLGGRAVSGTPNNNGRSIEGMYSTIIWNGTRPDGKLSIEYCVTNLSSSGGGSTSGGGTPPTPSTTGTNSFTMASSDTYGNGSWSWGQHNDIVQGYTTGAGKLYGCLWFDNSEIKSAISGKTIKSATLRLSMYSGVGRGGAANVELSGTITNYSGRSGAPSITKNYGSIGTIEPGQTKTITIPAQAANDLVSGAINGFVLYSSDNSPYGSNVYSRNYARFYGETSGNSSTYPVLTITY